MSAPHQPLETYLRDLRDGRAIGVAETSFYPYLATLLNAAGAGLKPKVRCILHPKSVGAGLPDGGLYTSDQLPKDADAATIAAQLPARGVLEVKGTAADVDKLAGDAQVRKYLARYGQVLVTNYRDFLLVGKTGVDTPVKLERYSLAPNEAAFWQAAASPEKLAAEHGDRLMGYLQRVMLSNAPLADPKDVAWFLASYARDARARVERAGKLPALAALRTALEDALGISFKDERGEHFFRSTLVQTLFYGIFSAWVLWSKENPNPSVHFDWRSAAWYLRVPMIASLFEQVASPTKLQPLGLVEVLNWTGAALNRVDRPTFFDRFEEGQAVQYFYEPFLEAFDPELRKELGVWYTPREIVRYQVERVDRALREELGIPDGLADERVHVLDPCCGTGAYLVEVLKKIEETLRAQGSDDLLGEDVKKAACTRVFGFELLPAPFVVAHLQLGLALQDLNAPLTSSGERVGVYLTNALTGWEPPDPEKEKVVQLHLANIPALQEERDLARQVKREAPILVILGNPPYSGYAGIAKMEEERDLSNAYRTTKLAPEPEGQGLNDLYVRFFRMAERRILQSGQGIVCYISNYSWLDGLSFTGMRERYLEAFDQISIDSLNGDKYRTGKLTPEGFPDPSVFSTPSNPEGIQVGTAITLMVRRQQHIDSATVQFRDLWGKAKRIELINSLVRPPVELYTELQPPLVLGLPLISVKVDKAYLNWPALPELLPTYFTGVTTSRDSVVVDIDRERLEHRMEQYFDPSISHEQMKSIAPGLMDSTARFQAQQVRDTLRKRGLLRKNFVRYCYRPFDLRWLYWEPETKLLDEKRAEYWPHVYQGNLWFTTTRRYRKEGFYQPQITQSLTDRNIIEANVQMVPLYLRMGHEIQTRFDDPGQRFILGGSRRANLTDQGADYLESFCSIADVPLLFHHTIAVLHASAYAVENAGGLRLDWPRVPLPAMRTALEASASLGRQVAALLDPEQSVAGVTSGATRLELQKLGGFTRTNNAGQQPGEMEVTAGWGFAGRGGITMAGQGRLDRRDYTADERSAIAQGTATLGLDEAAALALLGEQTCDVYLNDLAYWRNVPVNVWEYTIGGYQVLKKWLSYREHKLLGRALKVEEVREVTAIVRRIAALLLLGPQLDANYRAVAADTYEWKQ